MIEWPTLWTWQRDWSLPTRRLRNGIDREKALQEAIEKRRKLFQRTSSLMLSSLAVAVERVREGRGQLVRDYAYVYGDQLAPHSSVATTPHLDRLLQIAERRISSAHLDDQVWFEAISLFDQAVGLAHIEQLEATECIGSTLDQLIDLLESELFEDGFEPVDFYVYHNPEEEYMVAADSVGIDRPLHRPKTKWRKLHLQCRRVSENGIVYLHHRLKDAFRTWLKIQRQLVQGAVVDPFDVTDRCALMFVVPTVQDVLNLSSRVIHLLVADGACVAAKFETNYDVNAALDSNNRDSSSKYKFGQASVVWNDRQIELQFLTFHDYFSSLRALSDANHELYKLGQAMRYFFPLMWPTEHYGLDWRNPAVHGQLRACKIAQLGWAVEDVMHEKRPEEATASSN